MFPSMFAVGPYQLLPRHRSRRCQARTMALQLCGVDWQQQPQVLYARLRALDPPAFQELRLVAFDRPSHMAVRNSRYIAMVGINDANCLIREKRCAGAVLPDHATALGTVCQSGTIQGILIRKGPPGPQNRISIYPREITGRGPHDVLTGGRILMLYRSGLFDQYAPKPWRG